MNSFNTFLERSSADERNHFFMQLAANALQQYSIGECSPVFLQHNSGITYRIESPDSKSRFLLKIHQPVGTGPKASLEQIQVRMEWLAELAQASNLIVQTPVKNTSGAFVTIMTVSEIGETVLCTLQNWVEGEHPEGDFTLIQVKSVGEMMAVLHQNSSRWRSSLVVDLPDYTLHHLLEDVEQLRTVVVAGVISPEQFARLERASQRINQIASALGNGPEVCGPVHGDLHQGNILFFQDRVCPIDFDSLRNSYYLFDLGTTLYHILYQDAKFRNAFIEGYTSIRDLSSTERESLEAFVTWSAIGNLAFQSTIPQQVKSKLFRRNMHQLTDEFCAKVIANELFLLQ